MENFFDFFHDLLHLGPLPSKKNGSPRVPPVIVLYRKSGKNWTSNADRQKRISDS